MFKCFTSYPPISFGKDFLQPFEICKCRNWCLNIMLSKMKMKCWKYRICKPLGLPFQHTLIHKRHSHFVKIFSLPLSPWLLFKSSLFNFQTTHTYTHNNNFPFKRPLSWLKGKYLAFLIIWRILSSLSKLCCMLCMTIENDNSLTITKHLIVLSQSGLLFKCRRIYSFIRHGSF